MSKILDLPTLVRTKLNGIGSEQAGILVTIGLVRSLLKSNLVTSTWLSCLNPMSDLPIGITVAN